MEKIESSSAQTKPKPLLRPQRFDNNWLQSYIGPMFQPPKLKQPKNHRTLKQISTRKQWLTMYPYYRSEIISSLRHDWWSELEKQTIATKARVNRAGSQSTLVSAPLPPRKGVSFLEWARDNDRKNISKLEEACENGKFKIKGALFDSTPSNSFYREAAGGILKECVTQT